MTIRGAELTTYTFTKQADGYISLLLEKEDDTSKSFVVAAIANSAAGKLTIGEIIEHEENTPCANS